VAASDSIPVRVYYRPAAEAIIASGLDNLLTPFNNAQPETLEDVLKALPAHALVMNRIRPLK